MKRILIVLLLAACNTRPEIPENVLPPEKMQGIMLDLIHADGYIANAPSTDSVLKRTEKRHHIYRQVLTLHGTDKATFSQSLHFYEQHPPLLKKVLDGMEADLKKVLADTAKYGPAKRPLAL